MFYFGEEYINVFRTIPALFEYLVNILKEHPEILERNDITTFTDDTTEIEANKLNSDNNDSCCENIDSALNSENEDNVLKIIQYGKAYIAPVASTYYLTPEEVMEQVLIVEQQLDEYNRKN